MRQILRIFPILLLLALGLGGCILKTEVFFGENISRLVEYRIPGKTPPPQECNHEAIQSLKEMVWVPNQNREAVRVRRNPDGLWLKFTLKNESLQADSFSVLIQWINFPFVELCSENSSGAVIDEYSGYKWENWLNFLSPFPHFNANLESGEERTFYLRVFSNEDLNYPIRILSEQTYKTVVMFRFLTFVFFAMMAMIYSAWGWSEYLKTKQPVYWGISLHYLAFFLLVYLVHGKEIASILGSYNLLVRNSYYILLAVNHLAFFIYLATFDQYSGGNIRKNISFWMLAFAGFLYLFVPFYPTIYDFRIFLIVFLFGSLVGYLLKTHFYLLGKEKPQEKFFLTGWLVFQGLVFFKTLFHFDFYPYQSFAIYASVFFLPFFTAGSFLFLRNLEKRKIITPKQKPIHQLLDVPKYVSDLQRILNEEKPYLDLSCNEEQIANKLGITYHQLSEIVNSEFKVNFPTLLNQYRIEESGRLLLERKDLNVADVGKLAGFGSRSAFYLEFKKQLGVNPNEYRKQKEAKTNQER
ncbi:helix-turn-helix domain-containing protein [Leptospira idonii]|uniref:Helix-turn-helix domain-containing protein n=1 Tax=Leptospira idonii TaxID=1193500 RepID=A0A4V3JXT4_9LEPT|nr:helix-turn-helix domain-containing protein [Leptospira idonii]TGN17308.1 helix-turn-helix domain-containing protein [Leptospira idonii]